MMGAVAISLAVPRASRAGGDASKGKDKSLACAACHVSSDPGSEAPHLAGQRETYLANQLKAFRKGDRVNPLMSAIAKQLSDADVDDLAAFWSGQRVGSDTRPPGAVDAIKKSHMGFPRDFPKGFVLYLTSNNAELKTVKKTYINAVGFQAARESKAMPDGSVIIVVNYVARLGPDKQPLLEKDGTWAVDKVTSYSGMEVRAGWAKDIPEWLRNANWNYASFGSDKLPRVDNNQAVCLACHKAQAVVGFVFTFNELWDKAREEQRK